MLIADEPTSHLDLGATAIVARLLRGLADDGLSVILVVHDLALAAAVADTVVVMADGRTAATGPPASVLTPERLQRRLARRRRARRRAARCTSTGSGARTRCRAATAALRAPPPVSSSPAGGPRVV